MNYVPMMVGVVVCAAGLITGCKQENEMKAPAKPAMANNAMSNKDSKPAAPAMSSAKGDIIDVATGPGMQEVSTLVTAVKAAGLVDTLKGKGPFTVFAPTNAAFAKLPPETLQDLLKPENKDQFAAILLYHVHVGDAVPAADVKTMSLSTANGKALNITVNNGTVMVNNAKVIKTDVMASNGIIHWIDTVVLP